jgi:hypothetical protein
MGTENFRLCRRWAGAFSMGTENFRFCRRWAGAFPVWAGAVLSVEYCIILAGPAQAAGQIFMYFYFFAFVSFLLCARSHCRDPKPSLFWQPGPFCGQRGFSVLVPGTVRAHFCGKKRAHFVCFLDSRAPHGYTESVNR